jgi:indolepyruvate ferredoxin oxidoreductase beta subunit
VSGERPLKLTIAALGGQGGGVLAEWLIAAARAEGYLVQSTSVPGVAQRTGATLYYLEFFPRADAERAGREPVMALMPVPGDVDCVIAAELAEAGRAIQRGLVSPERTTLIASTHRAYAISEKSALGDGLGDSRALIELVRASARRVVLFDMEATAARHRSVISSVLLGALAGSAALPFGTRSYVAAIRASGLAVDANLAAFEEARLLAQAPPGEPAVEGAAHLAQEIPASAASPELQELLRRIRALPPRAQPVALEGARRTADYQDPAYAALYLTRLERLAASGAGRPDSLLLEEGARSLALWMCFEDTIRVADLKTRAARFTRVREELGVPAGQLLGLTEFMGPRVEEIAGTLPAALGRRLLRSPRLRSFVAARTRARHVRTTTVRGFLLLYGLAGLRRWRRATLRFADENARIEDWLARLEALARENYPLAVELARAQRLLKGYGETYERGWRSFSRLLAQLPVLAPRADGDAVLARLSTAALADEEGAALERELAALLTAPGPAADPFGSGACVAAR